MMDTILNLGMNDEVVQVVEEKTQNKRFAYDSYRRFIQMFGDVVMGLSKAKFEELIDAMKEKKGVKQDVELDADDMVELTKEFKEFYKKNLGEDFPQDPIVQLNRAIMAVFRSWNNERAIYYRRMNDIPDDWGTAVSVMEMVFGNMGNDCGTGVAFSRNPATGENKLFGEFLMNAQGEDVVAGVRTPEPIDHLKKTMPAAYKEFARISKLLEHHYHDLQDMEFTIEHGKLFMLQCRNGKRTANAALKIAVDMVNEKLITKDEALLMVEPKQLDDLLHPTFDKADLKNKAKDVIAKGLAAAPGAGCGAIVFTAKEAEEQRQREELARTKEEAEAESLRNAVMLEKMRKQADDLSGRIASLRASGEIVPDTLLSEKGVIDRQVKGLEDEMLKMRADGGGLCHIQVLRWQGAVRMDNLCLATK